MNTNNIIDINEVNNTGDLPLNEDLLEENQDEQLMSNMGEKFVVMDYKEEDLKIKDAKITIPYLTKYERTRLLGTRAQQLNNGSLPTVEIGNLKNTLDIARKELETRKIPLIVRRKLPNGKYEDWKIEELIF